MPANSKIIYILAERSLTPLKTQHGDIQACATKVASFFRSNGLLQDADELEHKVLSLFTNNEPQNDVTESDTGTDSEDED
jgi:hypothetical protein